MNKPGFFRQLEWKEDRMVLDGRTYRLQHFNGAWNGGGDHFVFYKTKLLVDQYQTFFEEHGEFGAERIFELGLWDGGSMVFWSELFRPVKHVGVDMQGKKSSPVFQKYLAEKRNEGRIRPFWSTNQADSARLRQIWQTEFGAPLDLV